jgi:hypothetical protein
MQGMISTYLADKGYGFIKGDDRKVYFFRKESFIDALEVGRIADEALVTFEECVTPKGYRADRLSLVSRVNVTTFVLPEKVMTSKTDQLHGWELLEMGGWIVHGASRHSPDQARNELKQNARRIGANALLHVEYYKTTGSQGNYRFTIHNVRGRVAVVGRRCARGPHSEADVIGLHQRGRKAQHQLEEAIQTKRQCKLMMAAALFVGALVCFVVLRGSSIPSFMFCIAGGFTLLLSGSTYRWIESGRAASQGQ